MRIDKLLQDKISYYTGRSDFILEPARSLQFGDLAVNVAFILAQEKKQSPMEVAAGLVKQLLQDKELQEFFVQIEAVQPGYINFYFSDNYLQTALSQILAGQFGKLDIGRNKRVVIEYSSPNTNKPLHLGHLRNDALGMALANIFQALGFEVIKTSVINDRGIHIMQSLLAYLKWGEGKTPEQVGKKGDQFVGDFYVRFHQEAEKDPALKEEAAELLRKWEKGDEEVRRTWQKLNNWVYEGWRRTYSLYGSQFDKWYYESDLYDKGKEIIKQAAEQGVAEKRPDGAYVIDLSAYGLGDRQEGKKVLLRPDGTTVYVTQDIYLAIKRYEDFQFDQMIYVVASEQDYHFKVLFKILELLGFDWTDRLHHYSYGLVNLPEGKMKSRQGKVVDADELIAQMTELARAEIDKREDEFSLDEKEKIAQTVALAAIKYWFLRANPKSSLLFDPKKSLDFEGDTGPYLLYSYVRLKSILRQAVEEKGNVWHGPLPSQEKKLLRQLARWPFILRRFTDEYSVNLICLFLNELAGNFNSYYHRVPVLKAEPEVRELRLQVVEAGSQMLQYGLDLLNIKTIEKM